MNNAYEEVYKAQSPKIIRGSAKQPVLVVFSAIPGSGKSELTKRLVEKYGFTRIANKDIQQSLELTGHSKDVVVGEYTLWLLNKLRSQEGPLTIVFDRNIDQWYKPAKEWAESNNYNFILVRIEVSRTILEKRLHHREGDKVSKVLDMLDFYHNAHNQIADSMEPNIILKDDYNLDVAVQKIADILRYR